MYTRIQWSRLRERYVSSTTAQCILVMKVVYNLHWIYICFLPDINDCMPNPCQNNGVCSDRINNYTCQCAAGYDGNNCEYSKLKQLQFQIILYTSFYSRARKFPEDRNNLAVVNISRHEPIVLCSFVRRNEARS
jgi:hypothetical protein